MSNNNNNKEIKMNDSVLFQDLNSKTIITGKVVSIDKYFNDPVVCISYKDPETHINSIVLYLAANIQKIEK